MLSCQRHVCLLIIQNVQDSIFCAGKTPRGLNFPFQSLKMTRKQLWHNSSHLSDVIVICVRTLGLSACCWAVQQSCSPHNHWIIDQFCEHKEAKLFVLWWAWMIACNQMYCYKCAFLILLVNCCMFARHLRMQTPDLSYLVCSIFLHVFGAFNDAQVIVLDQLTVHLSSSMLNCWMVILYAQSQSSYLINLVCLNLILSLGCLVSLISQHTGLQHQFCTPSAKSCMYKSKISSNPYLSDMVGTWYVWYPSRSISRA